MNKVVVTVTQGLVGICLAGALLVQLVLAPLIWADLDGTPTAVRVTLVVLVVVFVACFQAIGVSLWVLLGRVRAGSVFDPASLRWVRVVVGALTASALVVFAAAGIAAQGTIAPGVVGLLCGAALVLAGVALVVVVMKALLLQAISREHEATALRAELDEVV